MPQQISESQRSYSAPAWLTKEYLQDKLRKRYKDASLQITDLKIKPASAKGDNYTSVMLRIQVSYCTSESSSLQVESLIVKSTFSGDNLQGRIFSKYGFYERELTMYDSILPKIDSLLAKYGIGEQIYAKTIYVDHENASIIFEDLSESGFTMADRLARLDVVHSELALRKLAKFHAAAAVLHEQQPEIFAYNFDCGLFNRHTRGFKPMVLGILAALTRYIEKQPQLKNQFFEKLLGLRTRIMEYSERVFDRNAAHFMTLVHGDYWHANMMFKCNYEGSAIPTDVIPLDFQCCVWASPTIDLLYFFNTSLNDELRQHNQADLFGFYYNNLVESLKTLTYNGVVPSLFELRLQMEMRSFYGFFAAMIFQPIMICPDTDDADFMNLISDTETGIRFKDTLFKNVVVQNNVARLLPIFDKMGLLDDMDSGRR